MEAEEIRKRFQKDVLSFNKLDPSHHNGVIIGVLTYACRGDANRKLVQKYLSGHISSKDLLPAEWWAMWNFVQPEKPVGGKWQSARGEDLARDCNIILNALVDQPGQTKMEI